MRVLHIEGAAIHDDHESCVGVREGAGEALTGERVGRAMEPRNHDSGVPTPSHEAEGNIAGRVSASGRWTPRGLRTCACAEAPCAGPGRSHARPLGVIARRAAQGRPRPYA